MAGNYSLISIVAPVSAEKGSTVEIRARIKNTYSIATWLTVFNGKVDGTVLGFGNVSRIVAAGVTESWYDSFVMPGKDVLISVESWYKSSDNKWYYDDKATKVITLIAGQPVPSSEFRSLSATVS